MAEIDLKEMFPDMEPVRSPPALFRINGCGVGMYGKRDFDPETGTYVKTWCLSLLFLPLLSLRAYRVADAKEGWYFLGRVRLSTAAQLCNLLVLAGVLGLGGRIWWSRHSSTPEYRAGLVLDEGREHAGRGEYGAAARDWKRAALLSESVAAEVGDALRETLDLPMPAAEAADVFAVAIFLHRRPQGPRIAVDLGPRGLARAQTYAQDDPAGGLALVDVVAEVAPAEEVAALRRELLVRVVEAMPGEAAARERLAGILEGEGDAPACVALLEPHRDALGSGGVRILGMAYAALGRHDEAFALLGPWVGERLGRLHDAERAYDEVSQAAWDREVRQLELGLGPRDLDRRIEEATSEDARRSIATEYVTKRVEEDPGLRRARGDVLALVGVVPVALELGHVRLRRALAMGDADTRRAELEEAERTFLALQRFAGDTDEYRLFLGQVQCWLGRTGEGHALFDELLTANERAPATLAAVAGALREIGAETEARTLAEEAWEKETDPGARMRIAFLRAVMRRDTEDEIEWLRRCDPVDPRVRSSLAMVGGHEALQEGDEETAAARYREALAALGRMPESSVVLNETSLAWQALYAASGDGEALDRAVPYLQRAVAMEPSSTILRMNAAQLLLSVAFRDVTGDAIDLGALRILADFDTLAYLYGDEAARRPLRVRVLAHPLFREAQGHLEKAVLMAPENAGAMSTLAGIHALARDTARLRELLAHAERTRFDQGEARENVLARYRGEKVARVEGDVERALAAQARVEPAARARGGATLAVWVSMRARTLLYGDGADLDEVVRLAEEARRLAPSQATRSGLVLALLARAKRDLARAVPGEAAAIERAFLVLGARHYFAWLLGGGGPAAEAALALPDVLRAVELVAAEQGAFPGEPAAWEWALLRATRPDLAGEVAARLREDEAGRLVGRIQVLLTPYEAQSAYAAYWRTVVAGDEAAGREALDRCAAQGVMLPMPR